MKLWKKSFGEKKWKKNPVEIICKKLSGVNKNAKIISEICWRGEKNKGKLKSVTSEIVENKWKKKSGGNNL